jgi:hypothetical protein
MASLSKNKKLYEEQIFQAVKNGKLTAPVLFSVNPGHNTWESNTREEIAKRIWLNNHSMRFNFEGFNWYRNIAEPCTVIDHTLTTVGALLGVLKIFPNTAFYLHKDTLYHWDEEKQNNWHLCQSNFPQWLNLCS